MIPLHPELTFHDARSISEAGLRHTAEIATTVTTYLPNGEPVTSTTWETGIRCRLGNPTARQAEIAAAQGVKAQWTLVFKTSQSVFVGNVVRVTGERDGIDWIRVVEITADLGLVGRVHRLTTAVDTELNE